MKKLPYSEGTWFAVPLTDSGYGLGLVARATKRGRIILTYLFGPKRSSVPSILDVRGLKASDSIAAVMVGDLGLINGEWPVIGELDEWQREAWPMPQFVRRSELSGKAWRVYYSDSDPSKIIREEPEPFQSSLERDALLGYGALQIMLTALLQ